MSTADTKLEAVVIPVSDVDRAKDFYVGKEKIESKTWFAQNLGIVKSYVKVSKVCGCRAVGMSMLS